MTALRVKPKIRGWRGCLKPLFLSRNLDYLEPIWKQNLNYLDYWDYPPNLNYLEKNLEKLILAPSRSG